MFEAILSTIISECQGRLSNWEFCSTSLPMRELNTNQTSCFYSTVKNFDIISYNWQTLLNTPIKFTLCATAYSSSCSQTALVLVVHLHLFCRNLLLKGVELEIVKTSETPYFGCSKSFKIIDVDTTKKLITSDCYNKQHVCTYVQLFSCYTSDSNKNTFWGYSSLVCACLLEPRGLGLGLLKSMFNAENFICSLSGSISSHFGAIHS